MYFSLHALCRRNMEVAHKISKSCHTIPVHGMGLIRNKKLGFLSLCALKYLSLVNLIWPPIGWLPSPMMRHNSPRAKCHIHEYKEGNLCRSDGIWYGVYETLARLSMSRRCGTMESFVNPHILNAGDIEKDSEFHPWNTPHFMISIDKIQRNLEEWFTRYCKCATRSHTIRWG